MSSQKNDLIENTIGTISYWQVLMAFLISLTRVHISWHQIGIVFLAPEPKFVCSDITITDPCSSACPSYTYDRSEFPETIITQWDLVCDRQFYLNNVLQPLVMAGILIGSLVFGYISDRYGRKYPLIAAVVLEGFVGMVAAYISELLVFILLKFIAGIFVGGILVISFVITMEIIGKSYRTIVGVLFHFPYFLGYSSMGLIAYLVRNWRTFQMVTSVTNLLFVIYIWIIPESPRWLLLVNRTEEATTILLNGVKFNKKPTDNIREQVLICEKELVRSVTKVSYIDLVRTPEIRKRSILISFITFVVFLVYFGVGQYVGQLGGNKFINIGISGMIQIPANLVCIYILTKTGRRFTFIMANVMAGVSILCIIVVPHSMELLITMLAVMGIIFSGMCIAVAYIYTGELYPTIIRSIGMGTAAMCGKFGSTIVPFFLDLKKDHAWLPPLIIGTFSILAGVALLPLPETCNAKLPETIDDVENSTN